MHDDVTLVRSSGAPACRVAVCRGFEEVHRAICAIGKDIVIFDIFTHGVLVDVWRRLGDCPEAFDQHFGRL